LPPDEEVANRDRLDPCGTCAYLRPACGTLYPQRVSSCVCGVGFVLRVGHSLHSIAKVDCCRNLIRYLMLLGSFDMFFSRRALIKGKILRIRIIRRARGRWIAADPWLTDSQVEQLFCSSLSRSHLHTVFYVQCKTFPIKEMMRIIDIMSLFILSDLQIYALWLFGFRYWVEELKTSLY